MKSTKRGNIYDYNYLARITRIVHKWRNVTSWPNFPDFCGHKTLDGHATRRLSMEVFSRLGILINARRQVGIFVFNGSLMTYRVPLRSVRTSNEQARSFQKRFPLTQYLLKHEFLKISLSSHSGRQIRIHFCHEILGSDKYHSRRRKLKGSRIIRSKALSSDK